MKLIIYFLRHSSKRKNLKEQLTNTEIIERDPDLEMKYICNGVYNITELLYPRKMKLIRIKS